jgi:hypothetical protein
MKEKIQEAIEKISNAPQLQEQFKANPRQTLANLGLDPDKVKFVKGGTSQELSDADLARVSGGVSICANHGLMLNFESTAGA